MLQLPGIRFPIFEPFAGSDNQFSDFEWQQNYTQFIG
jgi:hypothetical protein